MFHPTPIQSLPDSDDFTKVLSMNGVLVSIAAAYLCLNYLFQNFTKCMLASTINPPHAYVHWSTQLHSFSDASESAYACVVYLHMLDASGSVYSSLVITKMKVTPSMYHDWSYVELVYLLNFSTSFRKLSNCPLTKSLLGLTALLCSAC